MLRSRHSRRKAYLNCKELGKISNQQLIYILMCTEYQNTSRRKKKDRGAELGEFAALPYKWSFQPSLMHPYASGRVTSEKKACLRH